LRYVTQVDVLNTYLYSFCNELEKIAEYTKGIPDKATSHELPEIKSPTKWEFTVHSHKAERRGDHFDLRLGDPETGHAHSWAMSTKWPKPGESTWAIAQPTHTVKYMDFNGRIESGYGKGDVSLHDRDKVEIINAKPGHISFNLYKGSGPEEYTLHRIADKKWKLINRTISRDKMDLPSSKPKYHEIDIKNADKYINDPNWIASAKIDDAHNLFIFPGSGEQVRVVSHRLPKKGETGIIEHTHKVPSLVFVKTPKDLGGTVFRGGLYAMHPNTGNATESKDLTGLLNSNVWKSREKQKEFGELIPVLYDVVKFKGKDMSSAPYSEKLEILRKFTKDMPFRLPVITSIESEDKKRLITDMETGKIPETKEGVVFWNMHKNVPPVKAKFSSDHDVYIREFFPGEGKYKNNAVGGFIFSHTPTGPVVGRVGTGLSDTLRKAMHENPDRYKGLVARVSAQDKFPSGALRAPAFKGWHLDKNDPQDLADVKS
jgi:hypothetical protein